MVDDRRPLGDADLAGGCLSNGVDGLRGHLDEAVGIEFVAVDGDDLGCFTGGRRGHEQRRLGQTIGRLDSPGRKPEWRERLVEPADGRRRNRFAAVEDRLDVGQIQRRFTVAGQSARRGVIECEVRCHRDHTAFVRRFAGHFPDPATGSAHKSRRSHKGEEVADHR